MWVVKIDSALPRSPVHAHPVNAEGRVVSLRRACGGLAGAVLELGEPGKIPSLGGSPRTAISQISRISQENGCKIEDS